MNDGMQPSLQEVIDVAHAAGVPVVVDAAAQAMPPSNLKKYIEMGADLVAFSGGKQIGGPQASGILCGRKDLVGAAALQHLDQDIYWEQWAPPPQLIDKQRLVGTPHHGIGRTAKVGRETVVGLLVALKLFVDEDPTERWQRHLKHMEQLAAGLEPLKLLGQCDIIDFELW
jgi:L-seryl-tRNA(Ser) seleniumtransferase